MENKSISRGELAKKAIIITLLGFLVLATFFSLTAGTWAYWEAWVYLAILFTPIFAVMAYLIRNDPDLLQRRLQLKERRVEQKNILKFSYPLFLLAFLLPGFDKRFGWSNVSVGAIIMADILVLLGYGIFFLVLRENSYASRIIEVQAGQKVISSGPYAIVRHPMYLGVMLLYIFSPLALGSWLSMIPSLLLIPILVLRIRDEEKALEEGLEGYKEYVQKTRYHLIPGIW